MRDPVRWHTDKYGTGAGSAEKGAAQGYKALICDALHALGRPAHVVEMAQWVLDTEPEHFAQMRSYVFTFGREAALRQTAPKGYTAPAWNRLHGRYEDWPVDGDWDDQVLYTLVERLQHYAERMRKDDQLEADGAAESAEISRDFGRLVPTRQGLKLYARTDVPVYVDRFRPIRQSATVAYDPAGPDWWQLHGHAVRDLKAMRRTAGAARAAQIDQVLRVLKQVAAFHDEEVPDREDDI